jgi:hypothetical protein
VGFAALWALGLALAFWQTRKFARQADSCPVLNATVIDRLFQSSDPTTYRVVVAYVFEGISYEREAKNFFRNRTTNKYKGDTVCIKVNPESPEQCALFS